MAVMEETVDRARRWLRRNRSIVTSIGGPAPAGDVALQVIRESGGRDDALTSQGGRKGFWEVGKTLRTVAKRNGHGTAYEQNIDPLHGVSSLFGMQADYFDTLDAWRAWLIDNGFETPDPDEYAACLALMHLPYSVGWTESRALLLAGRTACDRMGLPEPLDALRACLDLDDQHLPDIGPQTDETIRMRIERLLDLEADASKVEAMPPQLALERPPVRLASVRPFPRFLGAGGLQERLRTMAKIRKLPA
jgi:hypothetical protein